jgi:hypothetical protein
MIVLLPEMVWVMKLRDMRLVEHVEHVEDIRNALRDLGVVYELMKGCAVWSYLRNPYKLEFPFNILKLFSHLIFNFSDLKSVVPGSRFLRFSSV